MKGSRRILVLIVLHVMLAIWSCTDVLSKFAAGADFFSMAFLVMWAGVLALMGVYAIGWQQVIRRMPLATAFANKAITIVWGLFWGVALFGEAVTPGKIVGAVLVVAGIVLFVFSDEKGKDGSGGAGEAAVVAAAEGTGEGDDGGPSAASAQRGPRVSPSEGDGA